MYYTITKSTNFEITEKKSKFIATIFYVESKTEAENRIVDIKRKYQNARHNCYAYRILEKDAIYERQSDDGEPSGTAGAPILNILQKNNLCNILIIVTRIFGGILLGTGGLVRCYSQSTNGAIKKSEICKIEKGYELEIEINYTNFQKLQYYFKKNNILVRDIKYEKSVICSIDITNNMENKILKELIDNEAHILNKKEKFVISSKK